MPMQAHLQWGPEKAVEERRAGISGSGSDVLPSLHPTKISGDVGQSTTVKSPPWPEIKKEEAKYLYTE